MYTNGKDISVSEIKSHIQHSSFRPHKKWGQNFLIDSACIQKIVREVPFSDARVIFEIGAGFGQLTNVLAQTGAFVYACEIDPFLIAWLRKRFDAYPRVEIIPQDVLTVDLSQLIKTQRSTMLCVVGNIPYSLTTPIIEYVIKARAMISRAAFMVQKEVAERLTAAPGTKEYGCLSCYVQYYCTCKTLFSLSKNAFYPVPKVDSAYVLLDFSKRPCFEVKDEKTLFRIIRAGFSQRRKKMVNCLVHAQLVPKERILSIFKELSYREDIRAEQLAIGDFVNIANMLV